MKPQNEQRNTYIAISHIAKVEEYPLIKPVVITDIHMEVGKREELACAKPRRTSGILSLEKRQKQLL
jgi:hypothetical protein